jgi:ribonuclease P protein component
VRSQGHSAQGRLLRLSVARDPAGGETRFGLITSRRLGEAVTRNRIRRRLREICRLHRPWVESGLLVVVAAKPMATNASFQELREEWLLLARRLSILSGSC